MRNSGRLVLGLVSLAGVSRENLTREEGSRVFVDWAGHISKKRENGAENERYRFQK